MKPFKVRRSKIDNLGLYASKDIEKGTKILEYKGKIITRREAEENPKYDNGKAIYLFNLNKRYDLDGDFKFNTARLINHSCEPNCEVTGTGLKVWVHAIKNIKEGTRIIDYVGKIITKKQTEDSEKFDNAKPIYLFNLNKRYDLDGDVSWNTARLINHSCSNNCDYNGTGLKLWVVAIKDIKKGEEITCDYGFGYDEDYKQFPCKCNSKNCCGYIVRAESRWRINKKFSVNRQNFSK